MRAADPAQYRSTSHDRCSMASYYEVLGVSPTADQSAIRKAYLKSSLKYHPDKNPGAEELAKANFISIGEAYEVLRDPIKRSQYDLQGGTFTFKRREKQTTNDDDDVQSEKEFNNFMNMFDETVAGMSEAELRMAMGAAAVVGGLIGSVFTSRATKGNSLLSSAAQMVGSAVASRAASSLVQSVHTDSQQRVLERQEREAANTITSCRVEHSHLRDGKSKQRMMMMMCSPRKNLTIL